MRAILITLAVMVSGAASAAQLPLKEGEFSFHPCNSDLARAKNGSIGIYTTESGKPFITPASEGIDAYCAVSKISKRGNLLVGTAQCANGGMRLKNEIGTYTFKYQLKSPTSFVSNGTLYNWCAHHK